MALGRTITKDQLLSKYSDVDIFNLYLPGVEVGQPILSPFRDERTPSFTLFQGDTEICFKDFGIGTSGNAISFVMALYRISYKEAIEKIYNDLESGEVEGTPQELIETIRPPKKETVIVVEDQPLGKKELSYLKSFGIVDTSDILNPKRIWIGGKEFWINRKKHGLCLVYRYWHNYLPYYKVYFPYARDKKSKWPINNVTNDMVDGWLDRVVSGYEIKPREKCIIAKSRKDTRVLETFLPNEVVGFQSENFSCYKPHLMKLIFDNVVGNVYLWMDNDDTGRKVSAQLVEAYPRLIPIFTPDEVLPLNDPAGVRQKYGPKAIKKILKINGIL